MHPNSSGKKLASKIVTPSLVSISMADNITIRDTGLACSLSFSPRDQNVLRSRNEDAHMIEALEGMAIAENVLRLSNTDREMMEFDEQVDDLLGSELMEMEAESSSTGQPIKSKEKSKGVDKQKQRSRQGVPLGTLSKRLLS